ncbi:non-ribosomal peptide synthetase [Pseudoalteromonas umbrosa]|uniref:non-ribosomal peptide synthetase n=1 Tax=Pseudoalteromonas umbrosa TaxID=3048489 RepID=UPI0024C43608|nr:amino acid adenylation domain-containing protein [Pseudoalteromonas sp. B95]MDK1288428.1 amino acid adenylation domain-containing protein [Pseudoalteromonas sp. B95]
MSTNAACTLTSVQRDVYINQKKYAELPITNLVVRIDISGFINEPIFKKAYELAIEYHDTFSIRLHGGSSAENNFCFEKHPIDELEFIDLFAQSRSELITEQQVSEWSKAFIEEPITKEDSKLYKGALIKKSAQEYELFLVFSHVICDGWGVSVFTKNLYRIYDALLSNSASEKLEKIKNSLPSFKDEIDDEADYLVSDRFAEDRQYWVERLKKLPAQAVVPRYSYQYADNDFVPSRMKKMTINRAAFQKIEMLGKSLKVGINQLMQAAIYIYMLNSCNIDELIIGQVFHNRKKLRSKKTVGMYAKILPARYNFGTALTLCELLQKIKEVNQVDNLHYAIPLEQLAQDIDIYNQGRTLHSDVVFNYVKISCDHHPEGTQTKTNSVILGYDPFPLNISIFELGDHQDLTLTVEHNLAYYSDDEAELLIERLSNLIMSLPEQQHTSIKDINILSQADWKHIEDYNNTLKVYSDNPTIHDLFLTKAIAAPKLVALIDSQGALTYEALLHHVAGMSSQLSLATPDTRKPIAIYLPKGRMQLVSALAIMCSGHFYIPLETHWPKERVRKVIEKANIETVISSVDLASNLPDTISCLIAKHAPVQKPEPDWIKQVKAINSAEALAYVIFTSGSTGEPKGVAIAHEGAVNTLRDINERLNVTEKDKVLAVSDLSFDLNVYDFFGMLAAGGTIIFPTAGKEREPSHWAQLIEQHNVSIWNTVPASAELLVSFFELNNKDAHAPIRHMMLSGDWLPPKLPNRLQLCFQGSGKPAQVHSFGGATEASIWSITYPIYEDCSEWKSIPYGKPLLNQSFYVLNHEQKLQPIGAEGELYIGGVGVAQCYFNDIEKTNYSYIVHPQLNQRLYRTGDLGRLMTDGNIEFIGRVDHQVKINGFRIELGEIESHLNSLPEVKEAICQVMTNQHGAKVLNAYLVAASCNAELSILEPICRSYLLQKVPSYMLPVNYFLLDSIPLTPNGKVDRKALPTKESDQDNFQQPSTEIEVLLAQIWCQEIGIERIGVQQSIYEVGGASLNAIKIVMQINTIYPHLELQLKDLMLHYTIASLSAFIEQKLMDSATEEQENIEELEW